MVNKRRLEQIKGIIPDAIEVEEQKEDIEQPQDGPIKEKTPLDLDIKIAKRNGQNKSFYLDRDILQKLSRTARRMGISESKLINEILRKVLE